jgi:hypothetical protein
VRLAVELRGPRPRIAPLRGGAGAGAERHREWSALLGRFVRDGRVEYGTMLRVRRLVEVYLGRLAQQDPDGFADADEQLAFFLNAYNTIAIHQVLLHYPIDSLRDVAGAHGRSYPIGRRNLSLLVLEAGILRAFGDPRIHAAITPAALGAPALQPRAFEGATLQQQLEDALHELLADPRRGASYDAATRTLWLPHALERYAGDWLRPELMFATAAPLAARPDRRTLVAAFVPYLPAAVSEQVSMTTRVEFLPFDERLNEMTNDER